MNSYMGVINVIAKETDNLKMMMIISNRSGRELFKEFKRKGKNSNRGKLMPLLVRRFL